MVTILCDDYADLVLASLTSEGDRFAIGGVVGGLVVFALIIVVVIAVGILLWYRSVFLQ